MVGMGANRLRYRCPACSRVLGLPAVLCPRGNELGNSQYDDPDDDGADEMLHPEWFCTNCKAELINIHGVMHCPNCGQDSVKT